jgi:hypothetical protein
LIFQPLPPEHLQWQQKMLRISGKDGPYGKLPKKSVVPLSRRLQAPLEAHFALNELSDAKLNATGRDFCQIWCD